MELGTGIFLSALLISVSILYVNTRDRWRWKRIILWPIAGLFALGLLGTGTYFAYDWHENRLRPVDTFWGVTIGQTASDVKFLKGAPLETVSTDTRWRYSDNIDVLFQDGRVWAVLADSTGYLYTLPKIPGVDVYADWPDLESKLGPPSHTSVSKDETSRLYSYSAYGIVIAVTAGKITTLGIYDPAVSPVVFTDEQAPPPPPGFVTEPPK